MPKWNTQQRNGLQSSASVLGENLNKTSLIFMHSKPFLSLDLKDLQSLTNRLCSISRSVSGVSGLPREKSFCEGRHVEEAVHAVAHVTESADGETES